VPFWSRLPSIDMLGLSDKYLAHHPPAGFGSGKTGHELGDGKYVLSREPDLVILCLPAGRDTGCFRSGKELVADPEFQRRYALVDYQTDGAQPVVSRIWTRREGGAVGIRRTPDRIEIPGWQFAGNPESVMRRDAEGRLGPIVGGVESARLEIDVPPGAWSAVGRSTAPGGRWTVRTLEPGASDRTMAVGAGIDSARFQSRGGRVELNWTSDQPTLLYDVILKREASEAGR
jgi:hypothetical protein